MELGELVEYLVPFDGERHGCFATMLSALRERFGLSTGNDYVRLAVAIQSARWTEWEMGDGTLVVADADADADAPPEGAVRGRAMCMADKSEDDVCKLHLLLMTLSGIAATTCHPSYDKMDARARSTMMRGLGDLYFGTVVQECLNTGVIRAKELRAGAHFSAFLESFPPSLKIVF